MAERAALGVASTDAGLDWEDLLDGVLRGDHVRSVFQPIVDLEGRSVAGYEALTRFEHPQVTLGPDRWFAAAAARGLAPQVEAVTLASALRERPTLSANRFLSLNVEPESLVDDTVMRVLHDAGDLHGLVIEITEHRPFDIASVEPSIRRLRTAGARIAVDDAGAGHAGLQQILDLRPSFLKLDHALVAGVDADEAKRALIDMLRLFANRIEAWLVAEGVETIGEAHTLVSLGVPLAQGYWFARPAPAFADLPTGVTAALGAIDRVGIAPLAPLLTPAPTCSTDLPCPPSLFAASPTVVLVDGEHRPVGVVDVESMLNGTALPVLKVNVHTTLAELAHRVSTAAADPALPVVVHDDAGRYVGIVTTRRLLAELGRSCVTLR